MAEDRCEQCGAELPSGALVCRECKTLTPAGRRARGIGAASEEETWVQSVEAAKARHSQQPPLDPDEALREVVARSGTDDQMLRLTRDSLAHDDRRTEYGDLRDSAKTVQTMGTILAALFLVTGLLALVMTAVMAKGGAVVVLGGIAIALLMGTVAAAVYYAFRHWADTVSVMADIGDNSRRAVLLTRQLRDEIMDQRD